MVRPSSFVVTAGVRLCLSFSLFVFLFVGTGGGCRCVSSTCWYRTKKAVSQHSMGFVMFNVDATSLVRQFENEGLPASTGQEGTLVHAQRTRMGRWWNEGPYIIQEGCGPGLACNLQTRGGVGDTGVCTGVMQAGLGFWSFF